MQNLSIEFSHPWLLLLIIPAIALTLIPYFRLSKKYRRNRNRVTSMVLHSIVMVLAICLLAGVWFSYSVPNSENEIILLVDVSDTQEQSQAKRDDFVKNVINDSRYDGYKVGVVTFGFGQNYAVPLTTDTDDIYERYISAELPDTSATDIAAALTYSKDLFMSPETAKIVLVTDGKETDEDAATAIRSVVSQGTKVDIAYVASTEDNNDFQIVGVELPQYHINKEEEVNISVSVYSNYETSAKIELIDNGTKADENAEQQVSLNKGVQSFVFKHTFKNDGIHNLTFNISGTGDSERNNNQYVSYVLIEKFNKVLILERYENQSESLKAMLSEDGEYDVNVVNIVSDGVLIGSVDDLREYDQVILNNVSNQDFVDYMVADFDKMLETYVNDFGGGLFTVGGNDESGKAHAYNRNDMIGSTYQSLLPVEAIDYTPPVGLMVIIDRSGSMDGEPLVSARAGAKACLEALTERDYMGIMTLDSDYNTILQLTPCTQSDKIKDAIDSVDKSTGGTEFASAIDRAGQALRALKSVDKRHIIIVTDGQPGTEKEIYEEFIEYYYNTDGITLSMVIIGYDKDSSVAAAMKSATDKGHGQLYASYDHNELINAMRDDLKVDAIKEVNIPEGGYQPTVYNSLSPLVQGLERDTQSESNKKLTVKLGGFYGVRVRSTNYLVLTGDYDVPLYAQWKYGKGTVGSFMCDLNGNWSADFMSNENGKTFIKNVVKNLMPLENIHPTEIAVDIVEDNYINSVSVYSDLKEGEYIVGRIVNLEDKSDSAVSLNATGEGGDCYVTMALSSGNNYSRCRFVLKSGGVYKLTFTKYDAQGNEIATVEKYKQFSYSKEYIANIDGIDYEDNLKTLAKKANGSLIADLEYPEEVFSNFVKSLERTFDPRLMIIIIIIVLFLLDVAVRKFKFKWPHELIREYKNRKSSK